MFAVRHVLLTTALAGTLLASLVDWPATEIVQPVTARTGEPALASALQQASPVRPKPVQTKPAPPKESAKTLARVRAEPTKVDLFAPRQWQPPPKPPAPAVRALVEAPKAPPLPFQYLGKVMDGANIQVFVTHGTLTHLLRKGDVQAGYRVEEVTPSEMTLMYLQLNEKQRLTFGSAN